MVRRLTLIVVAFFVLVALLLWVQDWVEAAYADPLPANPQHQQHMTLQHWYPMECCNMQDCFPIEPDDIQATPNGFRVKDTGEMVPYSQYLPSQDMQAHRCTALGNPKGQTLMTNGKYCLFIPPDGV